MPISNSYRKDTNIQDEDLILGVKASNNITVNFPASSVVDYLNTNSKISIAGQMSFMFTITPFIPKTIAFDGGMGNNTPFANITELIISGADLTGNSTAVFMDYLVGTDILLMQQNNSNYFGHYKIISYTQIGTTGFYTLVLDFIGGNGNILNETYYDICSLVLSGGTGTVPNLQQVTDVGYFTTNRIDSTNQITSQTFQDSGFGTALDPSGLILVTNGVNNGDAAYIKADYTTTTEEFQLPNKSGAGGTFAMTSDIPSLAGYVQTSRTLTINGTTYDLSTNRSWSVGDLLSSGSYTDPTWITSLAYSKLTGTPTIPAVGTWGGLNYPTWTTGTPFVKMTAVGIFALDTNTYLTSADLSGYVPYTGATGNVNLGEYELKAGQLTLDTSPTGTATIGTTVWNNTIGSSETTLKGGTVVLKNGVDLVARVVNKVTPNATLLRSNYTAVRVSGAQGQRLAVAYAQANNDSNSADTIGLVCEDIATNQEGFIITVGQFSEINTTGSLQGETWADGDVLYLSPSTAGTLTNIKPTGLTGHIVVVGYVEYAHSIHGSIYVKIMNGWELDELHNVYITSPANGDVLQYNSSTQLWENEALTTASVAASTNKNYVTDTQSALLGAISQSGLTAYTGTITWSAVLAPSGTTNFSYNWTKIGNMAILNISLLYGTAGTSVSSVVMTWPAGAPTPIKPTGFSGASNLLYQASGKMSNSATSTTVVNSHAVLRSNAANNGFEIYIGQTAGTNTLATATVTYFIA